MSAFSDHWTASRQYSKRDASAVILAAVIVLVLVAWTWLAGQCPGVMN